MLGDSEGKNQGNGSDEGSTITNLTNTAVSIEMSWGGAHMNHCPLFTIGKG